jgi:hypothetical protein
MTFALVAAPDPTLNLSAYRRLRIRTQRDQFARAFLFSEKLLQFVQRLREHLDRIVHVEQVFGPVFVVRCPWKRIFCARKLAGAPEPFVGRKPTHWQVLPACPPKLVGARPFLIQNQTLSFLTIYTQLRSSYNSRASEDSLHPFSREKKKENSRDR